ncbi:hypothetical protein BTUL_0125g00030 [Botrytis tulipae]|uniref:Uncharacterized protein n=1 Tax=Botrytis tulipae TaxID=87230 RepID=A0A4Z1EHA1_9HELO|nr:hypothetical protein BTUL_0125g00030 [Botrytis tulipae]
MTRAGIDYTITLFQKTEYLAMSRFQRKNARVPAIDSGSQSYAPDFEADVGLAVIDSPRRSKRLRKLAGGPIKDNKDSYIKTISESKCVVVLKISRQKLISDLFRQIQEPIEKQPEPLIVTLRMSKIGLATTLFNIESRAANLSIKKVHELMPKVASNVDQGIISANERLFLTLSQEMKMFRDMTFDIYWQSANLEKEFQQGNIFPVFPATVPNVVSDVEFKFPLAAIERAIEQRERTGQILDLEEPVPWVEIDFTDGHGFNENVITKLMLERIRTRDSENKYNRWLNATTNAYGISICWVSQMSGLTTIPWDQQSMCNHCLSKKRKGIQNRCFFFRNESTIRVFL